MGRRSSPTKLRLPQTHGGNGRTQPVEISAARARLRKLGAIHARSTRQARSWRAKRRRFLLPTSRRSDIECGKGGTEHLSEHAGFCLQRADADAADALRCVVALRANQKGNSVARCEDFYLLYLNVVTGVTLPLPAFDNTLLHLVRTLGPGPEARMTLPLLLQTATPLSVIIGFSTLIFAVNNYRRQMTAQIFMKYTERYERILDGFPQDALVARFDAKALPP